MANTLRIGIEIPGADLAGALMAGPGGFAGLLDASGAAYVVVGADRADEAPHTSLSPTVAVASLARHTKAVGLVVAVSPQRDHPYNFARRVASLDHFSGGRTGVLALRRDRALALGIGDRSSWADASIGAAELADAVVAARKLWRTWPADTLDPDPARSAAAEVRFAAHEGIFPTRGPLNSPTTPQGEPVVFWRWSGTSALDAELAGVRSADVVLVDADELDTFLRVARGVLNIAAKEGEPLQIHVRARPAAALDSAVAGWREDPRIAGLTLVPDAGALADVAGRIVPRLGVAASSDAGRPQRGTTLRERLGIRRRNEPDLHAHAPAFARRAKEAA